MDEKSFFSQGMYLVGAGTLLSTLCRPFPSGCECTRYLARQYFEVLELQHAIIRKAHQERRFTPHSPAAALNVSIPLPYGKSI
jgi:hypothetical protein